MLQLQKELALRYPHPNSLITCVYPQVLVAHTFCELIIDSEVTEQVTQDKGGLENYL